MFFITPFSWAALHRGRRQAERHSWDLQTPDPRADRPDRAPTAMASTAQRTWELENQVGRDHPRRSDPELEVVEVVVEGILEKTLELSLGPRTNPGVGGGPGSFAGDV